MTEGFAKIRFSEILHIARMRHASDVHIAANVTPMIRIDGSLEIIDERILSPDEVREIAREIFDRPQQRRLQIHGDVTCTSEFPEIGSIRLHGSKAHCGPCIAIRMLEPQIPALDALGLPDVVRSFTSGKHGLIILAGATGCGKSTSLAALIEHINATTSRRIVTIEDPIEYRHKSLHSMITQHEIGRDAANFSSAILASLRSDPDVIVVGEMRDACTMRAALLAAETGHLVFATLHTRDASQSVDRVIDAFADGAQSQVQCQLAQVLVAVIAQRLVPRVHGPGRRAIAEILVATSAVRNIIRERKTYQLANAIATGRAFGMQSFEQHIAELALDGESASVALG